MRENGTMDLKDKVSPYLKQGAIPTDKEKEILSVCKGRKKHSLERTVNGAVLRATYPSKPVERAGWWRR